MSPSISISVPNETYQLLIEYQNETNTTQSGAGAALLKMGFAWNEQHKLIVEETNRIKQERIEQESTKAASVKAITKAVKAQVPKSRIRVKT